MFVHITSLHRDPNLPTPQRYRITEADFNWKENMKKMWPHYDKRLQRYLDIGELNNYLFPPAADKNVLRRLY